MDAIQEKIESAAFIEKFKCSMLQNRGESALIEWYFKIRFVLYNDVRVRVLLTEWYIFMSFYTMLLHISFWLSER